MTILAMETTQGACSVAISRAGTLLAQKFVVMQRGHAEHLLPMVETVRRRAGVSFAALGMIAVTVGPGTFTGVRVGLAAARALALVHKVPILGVGTLELLARAAVDMSQPDGTGILAAIDARRGELYIQGFDAGGVPLTGAMVVPAADAGGKGAAHMVLPGIKTGFLVGTGAHLLQSDLPEWRVNDEIVLPDAAVLAQAADLWRHRAGHVPPAPLYLRAPDAKLPAHG